MTKYKKKKIGTQIRQKKTNIYIGRHDSGRHAGIYKPNHKIQKDTYKKTNLNNKKISWENDTMSVLVFFNTILNYQKFCLKK